MPDSQAQVRWAHSVLKGKAEGDEEFAREVVTEMHGRKMASLPKRLGRKQPRRYRVPRKD